MNNLYNFERAHLVSRDDFRLVQRLALHAFPECLVYPAVIHTEHAERPSRIEVYESVFNVPSFLDVIIVIVHTYRAPSQRTQTRRRARWILGEYGDKTSRSHDEGDEPGP